MTEANPYPDHLEFGIFSLGDHIPNPHTGERISQRQRIDELIRFGIEAEQAGVDCFAIGESHQAYFTSQAHTVILAAIAQATQSIRLSSSSTIISTSDPVRVFEDFATLDLISQGRMEIIAGRASRTGLFNLLGYDIRDYDGLFEERFDLLRQINQNTLISWQGKYRQPLDNASVLPRPYQNRQIPIWRAVGGHETSAIQAGKQGAAMVLSHLTGSTDFHYQNIKVYRQALEDNGYDPKTIPLATSGMFYVTESSQQARQEAYPYISKGFTFSNGQAFPKRAFAQSSQIDNILNIGSPQEVIEKILFQYEHFGMTRYWAQIDFGGQPFDKLMKNLELIQSDILPAIRRYTQNKASSGQAPQDIEQFKETIANKTKEDE